MRGRNPDNPSDRTAGAPTKQRLEPNRSGKTNTLTSVQKDNLVMQINPSTESGGVQPYQQNRVWNNASRFGSTWEKQYTYSPKQQQKVMLR